MIKPIPKVQSLRTREFQHNLAITRDQKVKFDKAKIKYNMTTIQLMDAMLKECKM